MRSSYDLTTKLALINITDRIQDGSAVPGAKDSFGKVGINIGILIEDLVQHQQEEKASKTRQKKESPHATEEPKPVKTITIPLDEICDAKAREYTEKLQNVNGILVVRSSPATQKEPTLSEQVLFLFENPDERENWYDGLKSMLSATQWSAPDDPKLHKLRLIKKVAEHIPREDELIRCEVTIGESAVGKETAIMLRVPKAAYQNEQAEWREQRRKGEIEKRSQDKKKTYRSDLCKELVQDFVLQNFIFPAEGVSLYRYIRSLINRLTMEQETAAITEEMDKLRWNSAEYVNMHVTQKKAKMDDDEMKINILRKSLRERIGTHGPAAPLIIRVLERSIDKTKHYNQYQRHALLGTTIGDDVILDDEGLD